MSKRIVFNAVLEINFLFFFFNLRRLWRHQIGFRDLLPEKDDSHESSLKMVFYNMCTVCSTCCPVLWADVRYVKSIRVNQHLSSSDFIRSSHSHLFRLVCMFIMHPHSCLTWPVLSLLLQDSNLVVSCTFKSGWSHKTRLSSLFSQPKLSSLEV